METVETPPSAKNRSVPTERNASRLAAFANSLSIFIDASQLDVIGYLSFDEQTLFDRSSCYRLRSNRAFVQLSLKIMYFVS